MSVFAFDFGNVISCRAADDSRIYVPGAVESIKELVRRHGNHSCYLISKVSEIGEAKVRQFLSDNGFCFHTGFDSGRFNFCRTRQEKGPIAKALGITHIVDDRPEVMMVCAPEVVKFLFNPSAEDMEKFANEILAIQNLYVVRSWKEVMDFLEAAA